ncbi:LLM class flavin-dependent oxidoreductase [Bordetella genomosp. 12]|uniref:LLM class flavin-dependent oxidoreductase n=1 Tax=Bordetella genomosp. 12 TaxID=463035 RepID=A0A261VFN3_9BORD|nr:LLM class flavin-dependent oxidoreductase [Bordetella genomosp. 12]OZI72362.1 LLM class flavin-dependent oxidoreductase [Bordetella genomosp. 12]
MTNAVSKADKESSGRRPHPLMNDQKLKLGVFGMNCSNGLLISNAPTSFEMTWEQTLAIVTKADRMGFEIALPLGRWRGFGGTTDFNGVSFETYTWAAGLAQATSNIAVFATSHVSTVHPVVAAKQAVTIDHISNGRFGINLVMGWFRPEMEMFGGSMSEHDARYAYGDEWLDIVQRLWREEEPFDYNGNHFNLKGVQAHPKPIRDRPVLINAGTSGAGLQFAAKNVDFAFASIDKPENISRHLAVTEIAKTKYDRDVGVFASALVIARDTEEEARAVYQSILDQGDWVAAKNMMAVLGIESQSFNERLAKSQEKFVAGYGTNALLGTPEQITEQLQAYSDYGLKGVVLYFLDYVKELDYFDRKVMPLLKEAGLRH